MIEGFLTDAEVEAIQQENEQLKLDLLDTEEQIAELQREQPEVVFLTDDDCL